MLIIVIAVAKLLFGKGDRMWPALVMPALILAIALTSTRTAWIGVASATAVMLMLKDFRLLAVLPVAAVLVLSMASPLVTTRVASIFDRNDPTRRDRVAMLKEGALMVRAYPLVGVGPDMVKQRYAEFRVPEAVEPVNPHLHNVPMQIAAERGLPALAIWLAFVGVLWVDLARLFRDARVHRVLLTTATGALVAMLVAGLFEYNFGDSEFLMLFLLIVTLPFAAARRTANAI
jgi:putative inorganic carbon (HCO3(-)) transporter